MNCEESGLRPGSKNKPAQRGYKLVPLEAAA